MVSKDNFDHIFCYKKFIKYSQYILLQNYISRWIYLHRFYIFKLHLKEFIYSQSLKCLTQDKLKTPSFTIWREYMQNLWSGCTRHLAKLGRPKILKISRRKPKGTLHSTNTFINLQTAHSLTQVLCSRFSVFVHILPLTTTQTGKSCSLQHVLRSVPSHIDL